MVGPRILVTKKVTCSSNECKRSFNVERYGIKNKTIKDKCPFCKTPISVKFD